MLSVVSADQQRRLPKWVVGQRLVQCSDSETADLGCHFRDICAFIDEARGYNRLLAGSGGGGGGGACYVHCGAGISRAPTAVTAYLMHSARLRLREAFALVKRHRPSARPNKGFVRQLQAWEAQLFGSSTVDPPAAGLGNDGSMMPQRLQPPLAAAGGCAKSTAAAATKAPVPSELKMDIHARANLSVRSVSRRAQYVCVTCHYVFGRWRWPCHASSSLFVIPRPPSAYMRARFLFLSSSSLSLSLSLSSLCVLWCVAVTFVCLWFPLVVCV